MPAFFNLNDTDYLSPATQLLILSSIPEHAHYLKNFHAAGNWLTMEMNGLATVAVAWPEFYNSLEWFEYSVNSMNVYEPHTKQKFTQPGEISALHLLG